MSEPLVLKGTEDDEEFQQFDLLESRLHFMQALRMVEVAANPGRITMTWVLVDLEPRTVRDTAPILAAPQLAEETLRELTNMRQLETLGMILIDADEHQALWPTEKGLRFAAHLLGRMHDFGFKHYALKAEGMP